LIILIFPAFSTSVIATPEVPCDHAAMNINELTKQKWFVPAAVVVGLLVVGSLLRNSGEYAAEQALERAVGGDADIDYDGDGSVTVKTDQGEWSTSGELPRDWPSDVPTYSGAKVLSSASSNPATGAAGVYVALRTADAPSRVADFYKSELAAKGWTIAGTATVNEGTYLTAKKDNRSLSLAIGSDDEGTTISIGVAKEE